MPLEKVSVVSFLHLAHQKVKVFLKMILKSIECWKNYSYDLLLVTDYQNLLFIELLPSICPSTASVPKPGGGLWKPLIAESRGGLFLHAKVRVLRMLRIGLH